MADRDRIGRTEIQAVSRVSAILGLFNVGHSELVTAEVAAALGLNRTTSHRYLTSMTAVGLLSPGPRHSSYVVGSLATRLGAVAASASPAVSAASRPMQLLSDRLGTSVALSLWAATGPMVQQVAEPQHASAMLTVRPGTVLPLVSAQGAVFAAFLSDEPGLDRARASLSADESHGLQSYVDMVREDGVCVMRHPDGVVVAAAPLFDRTGLCASLTVASLASSTTNEALPERIAELRATAEGITRALGADPDVPTTDTSTTDTSTD